MADTFVGTGAIASAYVGTTKLAGIYVGTTLVWSDQTLEYQDGPVPVASDVAFWSPVPVTSTISAQSTGIRFATNGLATNAGGLTDDLTVEKSSYYEFGFLRDANSAASGVVALNINGTDAFAQVIGSQGSLKILYQTLSIAQVIKGFFSTIFNTDTSATITLTAFYKQFRELILEAVVPFITSATGWTKPANAALSIVTNEGIRSTWNNATASSALGAYVRELSLGANSLVVGDFYIIVVRTGPFSGGSAHQVKVTIPGASATAYTAATQNSDWGFMFVPTSLGNIEFEVAGTLSQNNYLTLSNWYIVRRPAVSVLYSDYPLADEVAKWTSNSAGVTTTIATAGIANRGLVFSITPTSTRFPSAYIDFTGLTPGQRYTVHIWMGAFDCQGGRITWLSGSDGEPWPIPYETYTFVTQAFNATATTARMQLSGNKTTTGGTNRFYIGNIALLR